MVIFNALQEYLATTMGNSFTNQIDTSLLQAGLGANSPAFAGLSIQTLAAQLTQPYAAAAAAAAALAARRPNIINANTTSLPYNVPLAMSQSLESPLMTTSTRTKSETKDKLAKLSIIGITLMIPLNVILLSYIIC